VRDLERLLGRKTMEVDILNEALSSPGQKTDLAVQLCATGRFPMKQLTDTLARSLEHCRAGQGCASQMQTATRDGDLEPTAAIRRLVDTRPTYGYRGPRASSANGDPTVWPRSTPSASTG
jgi:hypothetical protein